MYEGIANVEHLVGSKDFAKTTNKILLQSHDHRRLRSVLNITILFCALDRLTPFWHESSYFWRPYRGAAVVRYIIN